MSSDPDNFVEVDDGPVEFNMEQDFLQSNGLGPLLNSDSANGPNFVELDQGLEGQRGTDRSAAPDHNLAGDPSQLSNASQQQLPEGISAEMLDRLRIYYVAKEKRKRSYATAYKEGMDKAGEPVLREDWQKRTDADQTYQKELTDNGLTQAIIEGDLVRLKTFLVKRGLEYGDIVIDGRKELVRKLKEKYLGEEIHDGLFFGVKNSLAELAEMISIVLCYRTGLPFMFTAEVSEDITFPDGYFSAQYNPDTKSDLGPNLWEPVFEKTDDKNSMGVMLQAFSRRRDKKVLNEDEPGLRLGWTEWTDDLQNNQSPFVTRFHLIDELYGYYSVEEWRKLIYTSHPVCLFIDRYFISQSQILNLANAIREKDIGERNQRLIDFILQIIAQMDASIAKLKADLTVDDSWNFDLKFFKVDWDYVDWGKHRMLLALAGSELVSGKEDPLFALIQKDLIPDLDVYTWTEIINYGLMAAGVVFAIATFGWGTLLAAPLFALEMVITVGGLGMAAIDFYQAFEETERMRMEAIYGQIDDKLVGFESDAKLAMAGGMLMFEVLLTIVFPPSRVAVRSGSQVAARTVPDMIQSAKKFIAQADIPPNGITKTLDEAIPPAGQTDEVIEELGDEAIEELGDDALEELADDVPGMGRHQDGEPESAISGSERSLEPEGVEVKFATTVQDYVDVLVREARANPHGTGRGWDWERYPTLPKGVRWRPDLPLDMPNTKGFYPSWQTARERFWKASAYRELRARAIASGFIDEASDMPPAQLLRLMEGKADAIGLSARPPAMAGTEALEGIENLVNFDLFVIIRKGYAPVDESVDFVFENGLKIPSSAKMQIEHISPQRNVDRLVRALYGETPWSKLTAQQQQTVSRIRRVARLADPDNLMGVSRLEHSFYDAHANAPDFLRKASDLSYLDPRIEEPLRHLRDNNIREMWEILNGNPIQDTVAAAQVREAILTEAAVRGMVDIY